MLTYFKGGVVDYCIRVEPIPSQSTHLGFEIVDMTTQEDYGFYLEEGEWSYNEFESFVSFSCDLDTATFGEAPKGNQFHLKLFPAYFPSGSQFLTVLDPVYKGSIQFMESQSEDKPRYVNQIPLPENGIHPYKSEVSDNTFIILQ